MPGDRMIAEYFKNESAAMAENCLAEIQTLDDWNAKKTEYRQQLFEMLSLAPRPEQTDLKAVVAGQVEHDQFKVEKLHFQSMPGLYVTANLYLPKKIEKPAPAILYVCGHARVVTNGVSFGNKTGYQHHGAWLARNGYICLTIDTIQLGEIEGIHHGTHREGMWWWNARGYTPAGVEAWNCIRALDYLETRPEVDRTRFGVTGRSGGGAYSWWVAALDDRIKVAAPVAGITDLQNHVVDGTVEGHCDCMFIVNTYRWDYAQVAALVAPRPLLICNSDKDTIFPLDGVCRIHQKVRRIYDLHKAGDKLGLLITEGPHKDTQDLQLPVFRWFNRHLKGEDPIIEMAAAKFFQPQDLKVFDQLPADERTSKIHETFVPAAPAPAIPKSPEQWARQRAEWERALHDKAFRAWPHATEPLRLTPISSGAAEGLRLSVFEFTSRDPIRLHLFVLENEAAKGASRVELRVLDEAEWAESIRGLPPKLVAQLGTAAVQAVPAAVRPGSNSEPLTALLQDLQTRTIVWLAPSGVGLTASGADARKRIQVRRRFLLLGQTLDSVRVWDIRRAIQAVRSMDDLRDKPVSLRAAGLIAVDVLYASLFEKNLRSIRLSRLPASHREGPDYLNVLRFLDVPQAVAMAAERTRVHLTDSGSAEWKFPIAVAASLHWDKDRLRLDSPTGH
ncbi:MAG: prolyl oligopeptidase family serine peptidase [Verrucomicrobia bacterium]|nr:prolyl oligopeptidase family serine peptidase [Verrucomicrobiota bacterium]